MINFLAYLIAIVSVYRKYLLILLVSVVIGGYFLYAPDEQKSLVKTAEPVAQQKTETFQPAPVSADQPGRRYVSLEELKAAEQTSGYLPIGYFGDNWPAVITEVITGRDSINFARQDGSKHRYTGLDGYDLKAVRLVNEENRETLIVFRSEKKR